LHYARDGGWYPKGGSEILARRMIECIYKYGGKVLVKADVKKILVENEKICGIEMMTEGKTHRIMCPEVISTVGIIGSYNLLGEQYQDARYNRI
jgi:phytoene dehydrogenase-like protein